MRKKVSPRSPRKRAASERFPGAGSVKSPDHSEPPVSSADTFGIVAVGASAGGLEAFSDVLAAIQSPSDLAFVLVQHLSPQHASALPELLATKTNITVVTAANRMAIQPGHIYVMPPNVHMDVHEGALHRLPRPTDRTQFTPIDFFMQSLARWAQDRAVGVILSGTASDGAAGVREIKSLGGITIAQKPETARHDGMPNAAIATGMVDLILSPGEIGEQLSQVRRHPYMQRRGVETGGPELAVTEQQLRELFVVLRRARAEQRAEQQAAERAGVLDDCGQVLVEQQQAGLEPGPHKRAGIFDRRFQLRGHGSTPFSSMGRFACLTAAA